MLNFLCTNLEWPHFGYLVAMNIFWVAFHAVRSDTNSYLHYSSRYCSAISIKPLNDSLKMQIVWHLHRDLYDDNSCNTFVQHTQAHTYTWIAINTIRTKKSFYMTLKRNSHVPNKKYFDNSPRHLSHYAKLRTLYTLL